MIYLYAVTGPLCTPIVGTGLGGAALQALSIDGLTALYSSHDRLEIRADPETCWTHERAVEVAMRVQTVLPARLGTTFENTDGLRLAMAEHASEFRERLAELDGCVELAVRIAPLPPDDRNPDGGRAYLLGKLSAQRQREALAETTLACLREIAVASKLAPHASRGETVSISYLVRGGEMEHFVRCVGRLARRWPEFALSCTGPWAPYSFAGGASTVEAT